MRVLHAALLLGSEPGVRQQMAWEATAASLVAPQWSSWPVLTDEPSMSDATTAMSLIGRAARSIRLRREFFDEVVDRSRDFDLVILRHSLHDPFRPAAIRAMACPVASMHHTLEVAELRSRGRLTGSPRAWIERAWGSQGLRRSDIIVGVTQEIVDYELQRAGKPMRCAVYPNGCVIDALDLAKSDHDERSEKVEILFVAGRFVNWHGLDRLLASIEVNREDFALHLVGEVDGEDRDKAQADPRVVLHGRLTAEEIEKVARRCHVGLSSFALDRKGMTEACTLKVREYLKYGLPVYAGHRDVFPKEATFFREGPADITQILSFARERGSRSPRATLDEARPHIDKAEILRSFTAELETLLS